MTNHSLLLYFPYNLFIFAGQPGLDEFKVTIKHLDKKYSTIIILQKELWRLQKILLTQHRTMENLNQLQMRSNDF